MTNSAATADIVYVHEVRFGVVMYGGASLAIYINGVANELYEMACATPKRGELLRGEGTRGVYRKASWLVRNPDLRKRYLAHQRDPNLPDPFGDRAALATTPRTRFVVDTIAGTSAGGINGLFLAKALTEGQEFAPLKKLWIQEGDIGALLNDEESYKGLEFAKTGSPPASLFNSDRMYLKLFDAFKNMASARAAPNGNNTPTGSRESPLVDELDLFITTTDIRGAVVPLRLFDNVVYEKRYKQVYHLQYDEQTHRNDLACDNIPFLAYAARCTSAFPFAFEPMCVEDAERLCKALPNQAAVDFSRWERLFTGLSSEDVEKNRWRKRAFGDGGYLDNKPFSYVVDALSWRLGERPMERKLIYVEPAPDHPELQPEEDDGKPDAIKNVVAALLTIPRDETIREDLEAVLVRNRRIERVERIVRQGELDIERRDFDPFVRIVRGHGGEVPDWRRLDMKRMIDYYGLAFVPYRRLRLMTVTDDIAERLAVWWGIDRRSDRLYALRALVRAWREEHYYEYEEEAGDRGQRETVNAFLADYDIKYRLRRVGFLLRRVHQLLRLAAKLKRPKAEREKMSDIEDGLRRRWDRDHGYSAALDSDNVVAALNRLAYGFGKAMSELRSATWQPTPPEKGADYVDRGALRELDKVLRYLLGENLDAKERTLETRSGGVVLPELSARPPSTPGSMRTLQEDVFEKAKHLMQLAKKSQTTSLQELLEGDIARVREVYERAIRSLPESNAPLPREWLGKPTLIAGDYGPVRKVRIRIEDKVTLDGETALNTPEGKAVRQFVAEYYMRFDQYDQMSFPLYYDTGTGEPSTVEVLRVSPEDARSLIDERNGPRRKLAGTVAFNFGAFLDERWRRNDIMWGRLDGCERLLTALFPEPRDEDVRGELLAEAQRIIVREEMQPAGYAELIERFETALVDRKEPTLEKAFKDLWAHLEPGLRRQQVGQVLRAVLGDRGMVEHLRTSYEVDRQLPPSIALGTSARALTITGRILEQVERKHRVRSPHMVWLTRAGRALQALLVVSTPGTLREIIFQHWLGLLYVFELLVIGGAILFGSEPARTFGLTAFGVTLAIHISSLVTGDFIERRFKWRIRLASALGVLVVMLALLGAIVLYQWKFYEVICSSGDPKDRSLIGRIVCGLVKTG